jgi:hypothetical protein
MSLPEERRVFISYAHRDGAELAQRLHVDLANRFDTWLDTQRLSTGDIWSTETEQAIGRADVVLALLSAGSYTSDICRAEQSRALEKGKCVVPVRVRRSVVDAWLESHPVTPADRVDVSSTVDEILSDLAGKS